MWLIVFLGCLIPLILGLFWPRIKPWVLYLVLAFGFWIAIMVIHGNLDHAYHPGGRPEGERMTRITPNAIQHLTGSASWRFFEWGMLEGDGANTTFKLWLVREFRIGFRQAQKYDVTNPTPFHVFLWLLLLSPISYLFCRNSIPSGWDMGHCSQCGTEKLIRDGICNDCYYDEKNPSP